MTTEILVAAHTTNNGASEPTNPNKPTRPACGTSGFVNVTVGPSQQELIRKAVSAVSSAPMRAFLADYVEQPDIQTILTSSEGEFQSGLHRYTVQTLRRAAETAAYSSAFGGQERDAIYVATFVEGCRPFMRSILEPGSTTEDVFNTLLQDPLHRLDRRNERMAALVRMCLGFWLPDEADDYYVPRLRQGVLQALKCVRPLRTNATAYYAATFISQPAL